MNKWASVLMTDNYSISRRTYSNLSVPIIFSITGHIDIPQSQVASIFAKIGAVFDEFISRYPHTEFILMSALAEGADRIAASAAKSRNIRIAPVLPKPPSEYEKTFSNGESKEEFYKILNDDICLDPCIISINDSNERECFRSLAAYLIANSHIMIAVWDGRVYDRNGGTYDTIRMGFAGIDPDLKRIAHPTSPAYDDIPNVPSTHLTITEDCLLYIIQTDRVMPENILAERGCRLEYGKLPGNTCGYLIPSLAYSDAVVAESKHHCTAFFKKESNMHVDTNYPKITDQILIGVPLDGLPSEHQINKYDKSKYSRVNVPVYYDEIFNKIDRLNSDMSVTDHKYAESVVDKILSAKRDDTSLWKTRFHLLEDSDTTEIIRNLGCMDEMAMRYQVADLLAIKNQKKSFQTMHHIIAINVLSGLFFQLYILMGGASFTIFMYIILMLGGNLIYAFHIKGATYSKFIEYRTLSEAMRVNYYWALFSINDTASSSCYGYMKNELSWVRAVVKSWGSYFVNDYYLPSSIPWKDRASCILESWINGQISYHDSKFKNNKKAYAKNNVAVKGTLMLLSVFSATVIVFNIFSSSWMNSSVLQINSVSVENTVLISSMSITVLMLFKLLMITLSVTFSCITALRNCIQGGTPNQILAKLSMFDLAAMRLKQVMNLEDNEKAHSMSTEVFTELGNQCMTEVSDWAFENKTKDVEPTRGRVTPSGGGSD